MLTLARSWRKPRYGDVARVHACSSPTSGPLCGGLVGGFSRFEGSTDQVNCARCCSEIQRQRSGRAARAAS